MSGEPVISIIGLGKLGAPMVACFASRGFRVIGIDRNPEIIDSVNSGEAPVFEPGMDSLFEKHREFISATDDYQYGILNSNITFVVVPTPSDERGGFSLEFVLPSCREIGRALKNKNDYHLVVLTSTVLPGATEGQAKPLLEESSGKSSGKDFGLCYGPEFIALGSVIRDFLNPDFVLIGESDPQAGAMLESLYMDVCENRPPVARMSFANAELAKLAVNTFVTTKITFANTLARICEHLPGASVDVVTQAIGLDKRIGGKYLKGAIGYGGPCFPRDNLAFSYLAEDMGIGMTLASETDRINREQLRYLFGIVKSRMQEGGVVGVLGLSYKPDTYVVEESQGLLLAQMLVEEGYDVCVYDPMGMDEARTTIKGAVSFAESADECAGKSDIVVLATPWDEFKQIPLEVFARNGPKRVVIDCWRLLDAEMCNQVADYESLGVWHKERKD